MKNANLVKKSESISERMNRLTSKLTDNLDLADEMEVQGNDIIEYVDEKTEDIKLYSEDALPQEIINLNTMVEDFKFVRETLKENANNGRRVLNSVTLELLDADDEKRASLIMSFAELNRAVADNMKLYISAYKDISNVLLNINKLKSSQPDTDKPGTVNNTYINGTQAINTADLIKKLSEASEK